MLTPGTLFGYGTLELLFSSNYNILPNGYPPLHLLLLLVEDFIMPGSVLVIYAPSYHTLLS